VIDFLAANWVWLAALVLFIAMHRSGHGCGMHGGHSGHSGHNHQPTDLGRPAERTGSDTEHEGTRSTS
jgi:hypothetical protein